MKKMFLAQKCVALRIISAYLTVSTIAVLVLARVMPKHLLAKEMQKTFQLRKERTCDNNEQENVEHTFFVCKRWCVAKGAACPRHVGPYNSLRISAETLKLIGSSLNDRLLSERGFLILTGMPTTWGDKSPD